MRFRLFQYSLPAEPELTDLNSYVAGNRVASVAHHVVPGPAGALLLFVVETVSARARAPAAALPQKVDYREVLSDEEFAVFSKLRAARRIIADAEGVPVYTIFSNAQLAEMVRQRATTAGALAQIEGIGKARLDRYGDRLLAVLAGAFEGGAGAPESGR